MKKVDESITGLFRNRLAHMEMEVRNGFLAGLEQELVVTGVKTKPLHMMLWGRRIAAAASVALLLGMASAAFWYFSPSKEIENAFTQMEVLASEPNLKNDMVQEHFPSIYQGVLPTPGRMAVPAGHAPLAEASQTGDEQVSVRVSITITQQVYGNQPGGNSYCAQISRHDRYRGNNTHQQEMASVAEKDNLPETDADKEHSRKWALKAGIGTSLPKGDYLMPFTAGVTVERALNKHFSLEAGLQYNCLAGGDQTLHTLSIPLRVNLLLASTSKVDFYAMAGGIAEKCVGAASDNGFDAEPVQLAVSAGLGMRYRMNNRFALYAEPSVSHYFDTSSQTQTLHTERAVNLNLLCGVRMTF